MIACVALTRSAARLAGRLAREAGGCAYIKENWAHEAGDGDIRLFTQPLGELICSEFNSHRVWVFIMATGIVVRTIAPLIRNKREDPAVLVMDEDGRFVISLLSGHVGGANRWAMKIAGMTGATPVITTATDVRQVPAMDMIAMDNGCVLENFQHLPAVSGAFVNATPVGWWSAVPWEGVLPGHVIPLHSGDHAPMAVLTGWQRRFPVSVAQALILRPQQLILGIGMRRGVSEETLERLTEQWLDAQNISLNAVARVATVDLKADEPAIRLFCEKHHKPLVIITREQIRQVEHQFPSSEFVKSTLGVGSVAEPCAVLAGKNARLICPRISGEGVTMAVAEEEIRLYL